jgi:hypothetical protein
MATYNDVATVAAGHNTTALYRTSSNAIWFFGVRLDDLPAPPAEQVARSVLPLPDGARMIKMSLSRLFMIGLMQPAPPPANAASGAWRSVTCVSRVSEPLDRARGCSVATGVPAASATTLK